MVEIKFTTLVDGKNVQDISIPLVDYFDKLKLNVTEKLGQLADIVNQGVKDNIDSGTDIYGKAFAKLTPSTLLRKKGTILKESGALYNSINTQKVNNDLYEVFVNGNRSNIGLYLQQGRVDMKAREWFGISPITENKIDNFLQSIMNDEVK